MSELVIRTRELKKVYRLYSRPYYRLLDLLGLLKKRQGAYLEYPALDGVDLEIRRSEKVAIIGRNGAGKSTLLKILSGVIEPTSGEVEVRGRLYALLEIGAGFHPDFTGRQNVRSFLSRLGYQGEELQRKEEEIIAFAEIEQYIDQPMKTYSTGMGLRLMFSTSTAVHPDLLILDEVMSVGDAYFANKSWHRIQSICRSHGTTFLLVTHDIYSALKVCDRFIWLDRGRVVMDGSGEQVVKAYEASIRRQEEERLRQRTFFTLSCLERGRAGEGKEERIPAYLQIVPARRVEVEGRLRVGGIALRDHEGHRTVIDLETGGGEDGARLLLTPGEGNWGAPQREDDTVWRELEPFGSIFHRAPFLFFLPPGETARLTLELEVDSDGEGQFLLEGYLPDGRCFSRPLPLQEGGGRQQLEMPLRFARPGAGTDGPLLPPQTAGAEELGSRFGNRRITIEEVSLRDGRGRKRLVWAPMEEVTLVLRFRVRDEGFQGRPCFLAAFHREGKTPVTRLICDQIAVEPAGGRLQELLLHLEPLLLGPGRYSLSVGVFEEGYFDRPRGKHLAVHPMVMDMIKGVLELVVEDQGPRYYRLAYCQPARCELRRPRGEGE